MVFHFKIIYIIRFIKKIDLPKLRKNKNYKVAKWRYFMFLRILLMCRFEIPRKEAK